MSGGLAWLRVRSWLLWPRNAWGWHRLQRTHVWAWCPDCDVWTGVPAVRQRTTALNAAAVEHAHSCQYGARP